MIRPLKLLICVKQVKKSEWPNDDSQNIMTMMIIILKYCVRGSHLACIVDIVFLFEFMPLKMIG